MAFRQITPALRALSSAYVERRTTALAEHRALDGAGKRAAFALYYGPLHFLMTQAIVREVAPDLKGGLVVDLGCGTGVAGAAIASATTPPSRVVALDTHPWTLDEARFTYRAFKLDADIRRGHAARVRLPRDASFVVAAFVVNELKDDDRRQLLETFLEAGAHGVRILVIEPISQRISPWWPEWTAAFTKKGGRADEWRIPIELPPMVKRLARATGLRPEVLTARSLYLGLPLRG
ncbi:MAG: class I SAM-dependent methyltransferase [Vicinamibacterales bacterium]